MLSQCSSWKPIGWRGAVIGMLAISGCNRSDDPSLDSKSDPNYSVSKGVSDALRTAGADTLLITSTGSSRDEQILCVNGDGSGRKHLTSGIDPVLSPDGKQIAFIAGTDEHAGLYLMNADGSGRKQLTQNKGWPDQPWFAPSWSPSGE